MQLLYLLFPCEGRAYLNEKKKKPFQPEKFAPYKHPVSNEHISLRYENIHTYQLVFNAPRSKS